jgi:hypothetical protein
VVLDVRAHTLPQFQQAPLSVFAQLRTMLQDAAAAWHGFGRPVPLALTAPAFFSGPLYQFQDGLTQQSYLQWVRTLPFASAAHGQRPRLNVGEFCFLSLSLFLSLVVGRGSVLGD